MNNLVKELKNEDCENIEEQDQVWHLWFWEAGSPTFFCNGQHFGYGEGNVEFITKSVKRGGITCLDCLAKIKKIKNIKL